MLHTIVRDGWVMGCQSYTYADNMNSVRTLTKRIAKYPDRELAAGMQKALDDIGCHYYDKGYGGRRWKWPKDSARLKLNVHGNVVSVHVICETDQAFIHRKSLYDQLEIKVYKKKPDWAQPSAEREKPFVVERSGTEIFRQLGKYSDGDHASWKFQIDLNNHNLPNDVYFVDGGMIGQGSGSGHPKSTDD